MAKWEVGRAAVMELSRDLGGWDGVEAADAFGLVSFSVQQERGRRDDFCEWDLGGNSKALIAVTACIEGICAHGESDMRLPYVPATVVPDPPCHLQREAQVLFNWARSRGGSLQQAKRIQGLLHHRWMCRLPPPPRTRRKAGTTDFAWHRYLFRRHCAHILGWSERLVENDPRGFGEEVNILIRDTLYPDRALVSNGRHEGSGEGRGIASSQFPISRDPTASSEACGRRCKCQLSTGRTCILIDRDGQCARGECGEFCSRGPSSDARGSSTQQRTECNGDNPAAGVCFRGGAPTFEPGGGASLRASAIIQVGGDIPSGRTIIWNVCPRVGKSTAESAKVATLEGSTESIGESQGPPRSSPWSPARSRREGDKARRPFGGYKRGNP
jgi:hypothetical protein